MTRRDSRSIGMGFVALVGFSLLGLVERTAATEPSAGIRWRPSLEAAHSEAQSTQRLLWIQFTGSWCHFCQLMDRDSLIHPKVVRQSRDHFVPIKLQSDVHEELASRLGVTGLPATVLLTPRGEIVAKHEGYLDGETFLAFLDTARSRMPSNAAARPSASVAAQEPVESPSDQREPELAVAGFCPVSLVQDHQLVPGEAAMSLEHDGRLYRFANSVARATFQRQPERFVPVNSGRCPVKQVDRGEAKPGIARYGILYQGHLYLCSDEQSRTRFLKNPDRYCHVDLADRGLCPHCWGHDFVLVKGQTPWSPAREEFPSSTFDHAIRETARVSGAIRK